MTHPVYIWNLARRSALAQLQIATLAGATGATHPRGPHCHRKPLILPSADDSITVSLTDGGSEQTQAKVAGEA